MPFASEGLSRLLADPRQHPIVLISTNSSSAATILYRLLPAVACHAYASSSSFSDPPRRPAAVRLVTFDGALRGPARCALEGAFVDVLGSTPYPPPTSRAAEREKDDDTPDATSEDAEEVKEEVRRSRARAFTDHLLSHIFRQSTRFFCPGGFAYCGHRRRRKQLRKYTEGIGACAEDTGHSDWVHWVVPLALSDDVRQLRAVLHAWRELLRGHVRGETATLILFFLRHGVDQVEMLGVPWGSLSGNHAEASTAVFSTGALAPGSAFWATLGESSILSTELRKVLRHSSAPQPLLPHAVGDQKTTYVPLRLPCCCCWRISGCAAAGGESVIEAAANVVRRSMTTHERMRRAAAKGARKPKRFKVLTSGVYPAPVPSWQWLLSCDGAATFSGTAAAKTPHNASATAPVFPYILTANEEARQAELTRAVRRNRVSAAALRLMRAAAVLGTGTAAGGDVHAVPQPRLYTPIVADGGSPLVVDGCLSDIFVLEFTHEAATGNRWKGWVRWLRTHAPSRERSRGQRARYRASLRLVRATNDYTASPLPSRPTAAALLRAVQACLRSSGRGRGVLAWPLLDPSEGHRRLRVAFVFTYEFGNNPFAMLATADAARQQPLDVSLATHLTAVLKHMRSFGWVLVWQEDHRRWPTAVAPPCLSTAARPASSHRFDADPAWVAANKMTGLPARVAAKLEAWRRDQVQQQNIRYDLDAAGGGVGWAGPTSLDAAVRVGRAERAARVFHDPLHPSPYTSLEVWEAGLVSEQAGVYLWEGQTVFLNSGRCGTIVDFRPPPAQLLTPWSSQPTKETRKEWRQRQRQHAAFLRYYRWRRQLIQSDTHTHHRAAAVAALPPHMTQREQDLFPVVRLWPLSTKASQKEVLVHVLPTVVSRLTIKYPSYCAISIAQQRQWLTTHPESHHRHAGPSWPLQDVWWMLSRSAGAGGADGLTVLSLPLSPHRVETCASFFAAQALEVAQHPMPFSSLPPDWMFSVGRANAAATDALNRAWAQLHRDVNRGSGAALRAPLVFDRATRMVSFGHIGWPYFFAQMARRFSPLVRS